MINPVKSFLTHGPLRAALFKAAQTYTANAREYPTSD